MPLSLKKPENACCQAKVISPDFGTADALTQVDEAGNSVEPSSRGSKKPSAAAMDSPSETS